MLYWCGDHNVGGAHPDSLGERTILVNGRGKMDGHENWPYSLKLAVSCKIHEYSILFSIF